MLLHAGPRAASGTGPLSLRTRVRARQTGAPTRRSIHCRVRASLLNRFKGMVRVSEGNSTSRSQPFEASEMLRQGHPPGRRPAFPRGAIRAPFGIFGVAKPPGNEAIRTGV